MRVTFQDFRVLKSNFLSFFATFLSSRKINCLAFSSFPSKRESDFLAPSNPKPYAHHNKPLKPTEGRWANRGEVSQPKRRGGGPT